MKRLDYLRTHQAVGIIVVCLLCLIFLPWTLSLVAFTGILIGLIVVSMILTSAIANYRWQRKENLRRGR